MVWHFGVASCTQMRGGEKGETEEDDEDVGQVMPGKTSKSDWCDIFKIQWNLDVKLN